MIKVLIIEDDAALRSILRTTLEHFGFRVTEAINGDEGIKVVKADPPNIVLTDILMPDQDGLETISALRKSFPTIRVIAMSGGGRMRSDELLRVALKLGASGCLTKPFTAEILRAEINRVCALA